MLSDVSNVDLRDSEKYKPYLHNAFEVFVKKCKVGQRGLTDEEKEKLAFCYDHSVQPIFPALCELEASYNGFSAYQRTPHDILHTVIGMLEYWLSMVVTIAAKIGADNELFKDNISVLEGLLREFPHKQSMPYRVKHFSKGLSSYIPALKKNVAVKTTGYGNVGMMDNKDVPSLILQLLLCKFKKNIV
jgi:hypothetical protein